MPPAPPADRADRRCPTRPARRSARCPAPGERGFGGIDDRVFARSSGRRQLTWSAQKDRFPTTSGQTTTDRNAIASRAGRKNPCGVGKKRVDPGLADGLEKFPVGNEQPSSTTDLRPPARASRPAKRPARPGASCRDQ